MAETMQFDLVSPERRLASLEVSAVQIPATNGDMTAMPAHSPTITTLRPGVLIVSAGSESSEYVVTGGFAEISEAGVTVLAERAIAREDVTREEMQSLLGVAQEALEKAKSHGAAGEAGAVDDAAKLVADLEAVREQLGVSA